MYNLFRGVGGHSQMKIIYKKYFLHLILSLNTLDTFSMYIMHYFANTLCSIQFNNVCIPVICLLMDFDILTDNYHILALMQLFTNMRTFDLLIFFSPADRRSSAELKVLLIAPSSSGRPWSVVRCLASSVIHPVILNRFSSNTTCWIILIFLSHMPMDLGHKLMKPEF